MGNMLSLKKPGLSMAVAVAAFLGCFAAGCAAAEAPAAYDRQSSELVPGVSLYGDPKVPDISGLWLGTVIGVPGKPSLTNSGGSQDGRPPTYLAPWPLPYTPAYQKLADERADGSRRGRTVGDVGARCLPFGLPMMLVNKNFPDEIVQTPGEVTLFVWGTFPITIWTDGRAHPKDLAPSQNGHSIGYWVDGTLHVDTVGINGPTTFAAALLPHSPKLHIKWALERVDKDVLHVHLTFYDEDAFKEPVVTTNIWHRMTDPRWQVLDDASCFEGASGISDKPAAPGFTKY